MIGQVVGNYKIVQKLGEGGMGAVYRGVDLMLEREVAIKALKPELGSQPQIVERFRSEAVTLAKLNHPNVATLYSFFRQGDDFYMVLEFVRGETLDSLISRAGALSSAQAVPLFCQTLDGIDHAHRYGIVHRDIKPANVMLTESGSLKVLDFGIARLLGSARMTRAGHLIGTIEYMSPEQVRGLETDARSDIYSLGMLLYEMLTGRAPFQIENEFELMKAQIELMPAAPRQLNPQIPAEIEAAILRAIAKQPEQRFQTAGEFRHVLQSAGLAGTTAQLLPANLTGETNAATSAAGAAAATSRPPVSGPISAPHPSAPGTDNRETRVLPPGSAATSGHTPAPPAFAAAAAAAAPPAPPKSFFSRLTFVHLVGVIIVGAVVAALFALGVFVVLPLVLVANSGGANNSAGQQQQQRRSTTNGTTTSTAAQSATQRSTPQPTAAPTPASPTQSDSTAGGNNSGGGLNLPSGGGVLLEPVPEGKKTAARTNVKPPAQQPQQQKPRGGDTAAAERERRRQEALRALDQ